MDIELRLRFNNTFGIIPCDFFRLFDKWYFVFFSFSIWSGVVSPFTAVYYNSYFLIIIDVLEHSSDPLSANDSIDSKDSFLRTTMIFLIIIKNQIFIIIFKIPM